MEVNVYFISGMCVNCNVFKEIELPLGYKKCYIEWHIPEKGETLQNYVHRMADSIDKSSPFIIIGYSLGGIVMQEMNKILTPEKNILISSIKNKSEIPLLFRIAKTSRIPQCIPEKLYTVNKTISNLFTRLVYNMSADEVRECVTYTTSRYMKWATYNITNWRPSVECKRLFHIHGTKDQIFPYRYLKGDVYIVEQADHLMVMRKAKEVSRIISKILLSSIDHK